MKLKLHCIPIALVFAFMSGPVFAQTERPVAATREAMELEAIREQLTLLHQELAEVRNLLTLQRTSLPVGATRGSGPPPTPSSSASVLPFIPLRSKGSSAANWVLVQFVDPQCPFCIDFANKTLPAFEKRYVLPGKIRLLSVEYPLPTHPGARKLSLAAECAGEQGRYWEMHDALIYLKDEAPEASIEDARKKLQLDDAKLSSCLASEAMSAKLNNQIAAAQSAGVLSTPSFLIGRVDGNSIRGSLFVGDMQPEKLSQQIEDYMKSSGGDDVSKESKD